jgi:hypothetical protein
MPETMNPLASINQDAFAKATFMSVACSVSLRMLPACTGSVFHSKFQSLCIRRGRKRAIIALAHKLLLTIYFMLERGKHYRDSATDYEALSVQRNAPRWIKALIRFGFITKPA